jgi:hypothetical protein
MSEVDKKNNQEAFKQAEKELNEGKVKIIKDFILENLKKDEEAKQKIAKLEEQRRIFKKNIEDARNGDFSKIEERIEKSITAKEITPYLPSTMTYATVYSNAQVFNSATSGTYTWLDNTNQIKTIYF